MRLVPWLAALALLFGIASPALPRSDPPRPLEEVRRLAQAGDSDAQNELGSRLLETEDPAVFAEAREWFRRAMNAGNLDAKNNYAVALLMGLGGPVEEAEGRRLREEAAAEGSMAANLSIAERYLRGGEGYPRDPVRAYEHVRAAALSDSPAADYAQWRLAMMHLEGVGTPVDKREAYRLLVEASERGGVRAMISRAVMLATGDGVAEDDVEARRWYTRAAESGEVGLEHALRGLGSMLLTGEGGPVDLPRGFAYLFVARAAGDEQAERIIEAFSDRMTPAIREQAFRIAHAWTEEHLGD